VNQRSLKRQRHRDEVSSYRIAAALYDGPRTLEQIADDSWGFMVVAGLSRLTEKRAQAQVGVVERQLASLLDSQWVLKQGEQYTLTELGRREVENRFARLGETGAAVRRVLEPATVSQITLGVHLGLAAIKLPAGLLSGSIGLTNDAADTLLDAISSLVVYFGLRCNRERLANALLVIFMLGTGAATFYGALRRCFVPAIPEADWLAFFASIVSAVVCLLLWSLQRYVGLRHGSLALVAQSVDSRNHVIVAAGVTAGLVAALLHFPILDTIVGLVVALLILKSGVELGLELLRSFKEGEADLSRFGFGLVAESYEGLRRSRLREWISFLGARRALDPERIPGIRAMGLLEGQVQVDKLVDEILEELFGKGCAQ